MINRSSILRAVMLAGFAALLAIGLGLLRPSTSHAAFTDTDGDETVDLTEDILGSDPADAQSTPEDTSFPFLTRNYIACVDGVDNDHDGLVDSADPGCVNSDGDNLSDPVEQLLGSDPNSDNSFPEDGRLDSALFAFGYPLALCEDGDDNDGDGLVDAADPGCASGDSDGDGFSDAVEKGLASDWQDPNSRPEHDGINPISCVDQIDNDHDGLVDLADPGCQVAPNNDFADAIVVNALPFTHTAKVVAATSEVGEQQSSCGYGEQGRHTLWYRFTSPSDQHVLVDTSGSDSLAVVTVWREDASGLEEVDCNITLFFFGQGGRFAFAAAAGETYFIQLERFNAADEGPGLLDLGRLSFHMEGVTPPPNDDFVDAKPIDALQFTTSVDTVAAITEPGEPNASCRYDGYPANSVWYRYTPASDAYVLASLAEDTDFGATIGVYEGASPASLAQVACGERNDLAFHALAGHTYYFQAAGYRCQQPVGVGVASFCADNRSGYLELHIETFTMPTCPVAQFTFSDPVGDAKEHDNLPPIDATSVSIGFGTQYACITVQYAPLPDSPQVDAEVEIDADLDRSTGGSGYIPLDCTPSGLGVDFHTSGRDADRGLLLNVSATDSPVGSAERAYVAYDASSFTHIIPLSRVGGDDALRFAVWILRSLGRNSSSFSDCAPNGGNITCQNGACAFVPFRNGDVNCNLRTDSIDAVITLQYSAGLFHTLACPDAADINGDGRIDSLDASLILQFEAGLIDQLPPPVCRVPPQFC